MRNARSNSRVLISTLAAGLLSMPATAAGALDLCAFKRTFTEDFDELDVAARDGAKARWTAHTPWNGDFGDATFVDPEPGFPFTVKDGMLTIEARRGSDGKYRSGLLSAADAGTRGFAQMYGYFETRAKLPAGNGLWPAFWLATNAPRDAAEPVVEVDVLEHYGRAPQRFYSTLHVWNKKPPGPNRKPVNSITSVPAGSLYNRFHTYGVDVRRDDIAFYFDRQEVWRVKTPVEHTRPLFPLVNLAMGGGWPIDSAPDSAKMEVDYVHVYEADPSGRAARCPG